MYTGGLIVDKKYRGQGYAVENLKSAFAQIDRKYNIAGDSKCCLLILILIRGEIILSIMPVQY